MRRLTDFIFFKNTPLVDFQNTIHFESNQKRDEHFLEGNHYPSISFSNRSFNWIRDMQELILPYDYFDFLGVNYCTFISDFEPNLRYYAYVVNYEYVNDESIRVHILIDPIMTFTQGNTLWNLDNLTVYRRHLTLSEYNRKLPELRNNDDIIATYTKQYSHEKSVLFKNFDVLIHSTADLTADFGTVDNPVIETS